MEVGHIVNADEIAVNIIFGRLETAGYFLNVKQINEHTRIQEIRI